MGPGLPVGSRGYRGSRGCLRRGYRQNRGVLTESRGKFEGLNRVRSFWGKVGDKGEEVWRCFRRGNAQGVRAGSESRRKGRARGRVGYRRRHSAAVALEEAQRIGTEVSLANDRCDLGSGVGVEGVHCTTA